MKIVKGYLLDRTTGLAIPSKAVEFVDLAGVPISTAATYWQQVDSLTQADGSFTGRFELSPGPININVTVSGSEQKRRKHDENVQFGIMWSSDITRLSRGIPSGVISGYLNQMALSIPSGHTIRIATGAAIFNGGVFSIENNYYEVAGAANPSGPANPRIDLITLRQYNWDAAGQLAGKQEVVVTQGTVSSVAPTLPTGATFVDFPIGTVSTAAGAATKTIHADLRVFAGSQIPVGSVNPYAGATAPPGWLLCDGSLVSRSAYSTLFGVIGTTYGAGDGSTTFALPNLKGKSPFGRDAAQTPFDTLGETGGTVTHLLTADESGLPSHSHSMVTHDHTVPNVGSGVMFVAGYLAPYSTVTGTTGGWSAAQAHNNMPPFVVLNYIIKA